MIALIVLSGVVVRETRSYFSRLKAADGVEDAHGTTYEEVRTTVDACRAAGVGLWQADFEVSPEGQLEPSM